MKRSAFVASGFLSLALGVAGCDSKVPNSDISPKLASKTDAKSDATKDSASNSSDATKLEAIKPSIDRNQIPSALHTDAFRYYGLSNDKPLDMEVTTKPDKGVFTGSVKSRLTKVVKEKATFVEDRTGSLSDVFGSDTLEVRPDGVYAVASDKEQIDKPQLELPTGFVNGKPWKIDSLAKVGAQKVRQKMTFSCTGPDSVTIAGKTYPAMLVVGNGSFITDGKPAKVSMRQWFVRDIGNVKVEMVQTTKGSSPVTFTMIWKPTDSKAKS